MDSQEPGWFLQSIVDEVAHAVLAEHGNSLSHESLVTEVSLRVNAYLRTDAHRERYAQMRRQELREESGERALAILDVLIAHDPARLIAAGAPPEQYTIEAAPLSERLQHVNSREAAVLEIIAVMDQYFGSGDWHADLDTLSADIWEAWQSTFEE